AGQRLRRRRPAGGLRRAGQAVRHRPRAPQDGRAAEVRGRQGHAGTVPVGRSKPVAAVTRETREGPTPSGGARSTISYQPAAGQPEDKAKAVRAEIIEFDAQGNQIARTYAKLEPKGG